MFLNGQLLLRRDLVGDPFGFGHAPVVVFVALVREPLLSAHLLLGCALGFGFLLQASCFDLLSSLKLCLLCDDRNPCIMLGEQGLLVAGVMKAHSEGALVSSGFEVDVVGKGQHHAIGQALASLFDARAVQKHSGPQESQLRGIEHHAGKFDDKDDVVVVVDRRTLVHLEGRCLSGGDGQHHVEILGFTHFEPQRRGGRRVGRCPGRVDDKDGDDDRRTHHPRPRQVATGAQVVGEVHIDQGRAPISLAPLSDHQRRVEPGRSACLHR